MHKGWVLFLRLLLVSCLPVPSIAQEDVDNESKGGVDMVIVIGAATAGGVLVLALACACCMYWYRRPPRRHAIHQDVMGDGIDGSALDGQTPSGVIADVEQGMWRANESTGSSAATAVLKGTPMGSGEMEDKQSNGSNARRSRENRKSFNITEEFKAEQPIGHRRPASAGAHVVSGVVRNGDSHGHFVTASPPSRRIRGNTMPTPDTGDAFRGNDKNIFSATPPPLPLIVRRALKEVSSSGGVGTPSHRRGVMGGTSSQQRGASSTPPQNLRRSASVQDMVEYKRSMGSSPGDFGRNSSNRVVGRNFYDRSGLGQGRRTKVTRDQQISKVSSGQTLPLATASPRLPSRSPLRAPRKTTGFSDGEDSGGGEQEQQRFRRTNSVPSDMGLGRRSDQPPPPYEASLSPAGFTALVADPKAAEALNRGSARIHPVPREVALSLPFRRTKSMDSDLPTYDRAVQTVEKARARANAAGVAAATAMRAAERATAAAVAAAKAAEAAEAAAAEEEARAEQAAAAAATGAPMWRWQGRGDEAKAPGRSGGELQIPTPSERSSRAQSAGVAMGERLGKVGVAVAAGGDEDVKGVQVLATETRARSTWDMSLDLTDGRFGAGEGGRVGMETGVDGSKSQRVGDGNSQVRFLREAHN
ncbi:unnamed protein product, partial [Choristocarpus tenellus]